MTKARFTRRKSHLKKSKMQSKLWLTTSTTYKAIIRSKMHMKRCILEDEIINRAREKGYFGMSGNTGNMNDSTIREVSEIGFSPYNIFKEEIGLEYNHIYSLSYEKMSYLTALDCFKKHFDIDKFKHKTYTNINTTEKDKYEKYFYSKEYKMYISIDVSDTEIGITILLHENLDQVTNFIAELEEKREKDKKSILNIICYARNNFYLESFELKAPVDDKFDFFECYNDEFEHVANEIETKLKIPNGKGIVLIHGEMGTGKTTFLRRLITTDLKKQVIYMPPDLADRISSPEFVTFLMDNPNSILIIEDAENILKAREAGGSQAVSNLLNVSDGILGDALHLQIVCTFNCDIVEVDKALLRPGRLIAEYRFDKLKKDRATKLIKKLYGEDSAPVTENMSLAEIFNMKEELIKSKDKKIKLGFT